MSLPIPPWITAFVTAIASQIVALVPTWAPYKAVIIQGGGIVLAAAILIAEALSKPPVAAAPAPTPTPTGDVAVAGVEDAEQVAVLHSANVRKGGVSPCCLA